MKKDTVKKIFKTLYPNVEIITIEILEKNKYENGEWVKDSPAVFVTISRVEDDSIYGISKTLTNFTSHEFSVSV